MYHTWPQMFAFCCRGSAAVVLRCHCNCSHHLICARRVPPSAYSTSMTHKTLGPPPPHSPSPQTSVALMCMLTSLLPSLHQQSLHSRGAKSAQQAAQTTIKFHSIARRCIRASGSAPRSKAETTGALCRPALGTRGLSAAARTQRSIRGGGGG
jgi:hypothetical protein